MKLVVAVTGASGIIYAVNFMQTIKDQNIEIHLIITKAARRVAKYETGSAEMLESLANYNYEPEDLDAPIASGSYDVDGMVIVPCSMKTIGALANGYAENLVVRAADVQLKERKPLILVPRETPLHAIHLDNMSKLSKIGAIILPAMPGFYHNPERINDLASFISGKILDQLGIRNNLFKRWKI